MEEKMEAIQIPKTAITSLLEEMGVEYKTDEYGKIMVHGFIHYVEANPKLVTEIDIITNNGTKVSFSYFSEANRLLIETRTRIKDLILPKTVTAYYEFPYLVISP